MDTGLRDQVAIVTGAGRIGGIGEAIARSLAAEGAKVVLSDIGRSFERSPEYQWRRGATSRIFARASTSGRRSSTRRLQGKGRREPRRGDGRALRPARGAAGAGCHQQRLLVLRGPSSRGGLVRKVRPSVSLLRQTLPDESASPIPDRSARPSVARGGSPLGGVTGSGGFARRPGEGVRRRPVIPS
jgi:hypothetical protein